MVLILKISILAVKQRKVDIEYPDERSVATMTPDEQMLILHTLLFHNQFKKHGVRRLL
jgi:hypothetical protein